MLKYSSSGDSPSSPTLPTTSSVNPFIVTMPAKPPCSSKQIATWCPFSLNSSKSSPVVFVSGTK